jgi:two-component system phosphate regulon response regulator PhoB
MGNKNEFLEKLAFTVLVIDDNPVLQEIIHDTIKFYYPNSRIIESNSGQAGFELAQTWQPDVIFLDFVLPDTTGYEVAQRLRTSHATIDIPIIATTSSNQNDREVMSFFRICDRVLQKPFELRLLRHIIEMVLLRRSLRVPG